jgi:hypothetical protein
VSRALKLSFAALAAVLSTAFAPFAPLALAAAASPGPGCSLTAPPHRLTTAPSALPDSYTAARVGGIVVDEAVIAKDGSLSGVRVVRARLESLAPFARKSIRDSRFQPASIDCNPVATRVQIATILGTVAKARIEPEYDILWAHVPAGQSREAAWQLAQSVERIAISAHVGTALPAGGEIVARAPDGKETVLVKIPPSQEPVDVAEIVSTGKLFWKAGDYGLEIRGGGKSLASTTLTIADDHSRAIVNACEPI